MLTLASTLLLAGALSLAVWLREGLPFDSYDTDWDVIFVLYFLVPVYAVVAGLTTIGIVGLVPRLRWVVGLVITAALFPWERLG